MTDKTEQSSRRTTSIVGALCGIVGVVLLAASFALVTGPQNNASQAEVIQFAHDHRSAILVGAWLQAFAPVLIATFAFALVQLSGAVTSVSGWMTLLGMSILVAISLMEVTFYVCALSTEPPGNPLISVQIIDAVQHLYFVVAAPAVFLPLGLILRGSRVLPRAFSYMALGLAVLFFALGAAYLLTVALPTPVTAVGAIQSLWWLSAAISLAIRSGNAIEV